MKNNIDTDTLQLLEAIKNICCEHGFISDKPYTSDYSSGYSRIYNLIISFIICNSPKEF